MLRPSMGIDGRFEISEGLQVLRDTSRNFISFEDRLNILDKGFWILSFSNKLLM